MWTCVSLSCAPGCTAAPVISMQASPGSDIASGSALEALLNETTCIHHTSTLNLGIYRYKYDGNEALIHTTPSLLIAER